MVFHEIVPYFERACPLQGDKQSEANTHDGSSKTGEFNIIVDEVLEENAVVDEPRTPENTGNEDSGGNESEGNKDSNSDGSHFDYEGQLETDDVHDFGPKEDSTTTATATEEVTNAET